ncbi:hypothetical protein H4R20_005056, partial [Coemansia guatemalensis]
MFSSPSVRVRRRQTPKPVEGGADSNDNSTVSKQALKRGISLAGQGRANTQCSEQHEPAHPTTMLDAAQQQRQHHEMARKRQATGPNLPGWLAQANQQLITGARSEEGHIHGRSEQREPKEIGPGERAPESAGLLSAGAPRGEADAAASEATGRRTLLRGEKHAVFGVAGFPEVVRRQVAAAELRGAAVAAGLSSIGSFAYVATAAECSVWAYGGAGSAINRVHRLVMPGSASVVETEPPLVILTAAGNEQTDVGVVVCSASGQLRYWDRVAFGLGGTDRFLSHTLELNDAADRCCRIAEVHAGLVVVGTEKGRLFCVTMLSAQGAPQLDAYALRGGSARAGVLGRVSSLLGASAHAPAVAETDDALVALAGGGRTEIRHSRELLVLTRGRLAKWVVSRTHPERLMYSIDIARALAAAAPGADAAVLDVAVMRSGDVCVLAALQTSSAARRLQLAIAVLRSSRVSAEPNVVHLWRLGLVYDGALGHSGAERPRLALPDGGPAIYVVFRRAVAALVATASGFAFEETMSFRPSDPVLGIAAAPLFPYALQEPSESRFALVCQSAGILNVTVDITKVLGSVATALPGPDAAVRRLPSAPGPAREFQ